ncbi:MAG: DUF1015 domain-containing protein [Peptococcaceae bacterium]|nr:DUF1015 domain-containing protein [Peptococcaceae bacterium]
MAAIIPFRGIRYNPEKVKNLADVVTPPYDVIDHAAQERYYRKHPYNIIRLEYGKVNEGDGPGGNRYTRAAAHFSQWMGEDVLVREKTPALYLYDQEFAAAGRKKVRSGFICAVKIEPYERGVVLPHEETLPKHKADRLELMRACRANFSPIFGLYADPEMAVTGALRQAAGRREPDAAFTDENGEIHRLWVISDGETVRSVQRTMAEKRIFIADGHHRYETAMNYRAERAAAGDTGTEAYNYVMMTLVNLYDPGLVILPTHRLVRNVDQGDISALPQRLLENFRLEEFRLSPQRENFKEFLDLLAGRGADPAGRWKHRHVFGIYTGGGKLFLASLKNEDGLAELMPQGKSPAWQGLDVSVLHCLIVEKHLGIGPELLAKGDHVTYTREEEGALAAVDSGEYQLALFLNPTMVEEVTEVAANTEKMPQKSTFFYPKMITGLVINPLD